MHRRESDRWVTPGVVIWFLICATVVVLCVIGVVGYLTVRGYDPQPVVELVAQLVTAVGALGGLALQLVNRRTVTKVERNTGQAVNAVLDVDDRVVELAAAVRAPQTTAIPPVRSRPPVPPSTPLWEADE